MGGGGVLGHPAHESPNQSAMEGRGGSAPDEVLVVGDDDELEVPLPAPVRDQTTDLHQNGNELSSNFIKQHFQKGEKIVNPNVLTFFGPATLKIQSSQMF